LWRMLEFGLFSDGKLARAHALQFDRRVDIELGKLKSLYKSIVYGN
jgi:hypothetical protein